MHIRHLLRRPAPTIPHDADRDTALRRLEEAEAGAVVVTDPKGRSQGLLTRAALESSQAAPTQVAVAVGLEQDEDIDRAKDLMIHHGVAVVPVLRRGRPIGLLTRDDILDFMRNQAPPIMAAEA